jgi:ABC-type branched-subunit amino acid transport system ATPase component
MLQRRARSTQPIFFTGESNRAGPDFLSGGKQQMLTIGRAPMTHPGAVVLDEPGEGPALSIVKLTGHADIYGIPCC